MQLIQLNQHTTQQLPPLAFTIGNFDGVHLGHQAILQRLKDTAASQQLKTAVMFFEPQPKEFFASVNEQITAPARISSWQEKADLLAALGIDFVILANFDQAFREQTAQDFAEKLQQLNVKHILVGDDFRFGHDRSGDASYLMQAGFCVDKLDTVLLDAQRISSTRIRQCLANGELAQAATLLGRGYSITGVVEYGDQIGRTIDFPTANVALNRPTPCLHGIYAVEVVSLGNKPLPAFATGKHTGMAGFSENSLFGAAHVGTRPAIKNKPAQWRLEVHLPKFAGDLYHSQLKVTFLHFLHGERNYNGLTELKTGILNDVQQLIAWRQSIAKKPF